MVNPVESEQEKYEEDEDEKMLTIPIRLEACVNINSARFFFTDASI